MKLGSVHHLHFVGIGGVGMCALAEVLLSDGFTVSGCDAEPSERTERLARRGASVLVGHDPAHLDGVDAVVVTAAVDRSTPEVAAARSRGIPVVRRADLLGELVRRGEGVAVAGTHGKTTTTSLVGWVLTQAGLDPTVLVGGHVRFLDAHAHRGHGDLVVCEADEYDRSFLALRPVWAVLTNVEAEHLDSYGSLADLEDAFVSFADSVPFYGAVVACVDDPGVRRLLPRLENRVVAYGTTPGVALRATGVEAGVWGTRFTVANHDVELGRLALPLAGLHNVRNALAAVAVGLELEIPFAVIADALAAFSGVARRFDVRGERTGVTVVDDYAHHPTELRAVLAAARQVFPGRRRVAAFQPHLYSRTRDFADEFGTALAEAEVVVVLPIYPAREQPLPGVSSALVAEAARAGGATRVVEPASLDEALAGLSALLEPGDVLLTLGAGDVHRLGERWLGGDA